MDWANATWTKLTWLDWAVLEDCLRIKRQAHVNRDKELTAEQKVTECLVIRDEVISFGDVYRFGRHDVDGAYIAATLSLKTAHPDITSEMVRVEFSTPFPLFMLFEQQDLFGVKLQRTSLGNAPSASVIALTGGQSSQP